MILSGDKGWWAPSSCSSSALLNSEGTIFFSLSLPLVSSLCSTGGCCFSFSFSFFFFPFTLKFFLLFFVFCSLFLFYPFIFLFFLFWQVPSLKTLFLCLAPANGHHLCALHLLHSRSPVYPRRKLLHISGAPVLCLVTQFLWLPPWTYPLITLLWRPGGPWFLGPMILRQLERQLLAEYHSQDTPHIAD